MHPAPVPSHAGQDSAQPFLAAAEAAVDEAGRILRRYFRTVPDAECKADHSPVTIADRQAETAMRAVLAARHPNHDVLGEEGGATFARSAADTNRYRWIIDPIDGTRAYITGRPTFGTLLALMDGAVPILGIIDQPITGERWVGMAGRPTRFSGNIGGRIGPRTDRTLEQCELSATTPAMFAPAEAARFAALAARTARVSYGGDCIAYGLLTLGLIDIVAEASLSLWDWAALLPVIEGAGGSLTDWEGAPLPPTPGKQRVLALANPALLPHAAAALRAPPQETTP